MKAVKTATLIKNMMNSYVKENGLVNADVTKEGTRFVTLAPTRFHFGQIKVFTPEYGVWVADYNQPGKLGTPKQITQLETGAWIIVN